MHEFNDRTSTITIYTTKRPTHTSYKRSPAIIMSPSCGFSLNLIPTEADHFLQKTRELGYIATIGHDFFRQGRITCSDPDRQVSIGLLYYCLIGEANKHIGADPNDYLYRPENTHRFLSLDYRPSPDDLLWKPYTIILSLNYVAFLFMAPDPKNPTGPVLTTTLVFDKLAFAFEFSIVYPKLNERETYICHWRPSDYPYAYGHHAPFHIHYELVFNSGLVANGIATRTIDYNSYPGVRSLKPIDNIRIFGREVKILD